jgi:YggT family protein
VSLASCQFFFALDKVIWLYTLIMLVYAVLSWVPDLRGNWSRYISMLVEPVLVPVRRVIPPAGGIDWSFMVVLAILWVIDNFIVRPNAFACY